MTVAGDISEEETLAWIISLESTVLLLSLPNEELSWACSSCFTDSKIIPLACISSLFSSSFCNSFVSSLKGDFLLSKGSSTCFNFLRVFSENLWSSLVKVAADSAHLFFVLVLNCRDFFEASERLFAGNGISDVRRLRLILTRSHKSDSAAWFCDSSQSAKLARVDENVSSSCWLVSGCCFELSSAFDSSSTSLLIKGSSNKETKPSKSKLPCAWFLELLERPSDCNPFFKDWGETLSLFRLFLQVNNGPSWAFLAELSILIASLSLTPSIKNSSLLGEASSWFLTWISPTTTSHRCSRQSCDGKIETLCIVSKLLGEKHSHLVLDTAPSSPLLSPFTGTGAKVGEREILFSMNTELSRGLVFIEESASATVFEHTARLGCPEAICRLSLQSMVWQLTTHSDSTNWDDTWLVVIAWSCSVSPAIEAPSTAWDVEP